jgi:hypothetical protein
MAYGDAGMSEDRRRLGIRTRLGTGAANPAGRVGEPNVLSDAAMPNRLSSEVARPANVSTLTDGPAARLAGPGYLRPGTVPIPVEPQPTGRRAPTLSTLLVVGFVVLTIARLAGQFLEGSSFGSPEETSPPATLAPVPGPGSVIFGTGLTEFCGVSEPAAQFPTGTEVWWSAEMSAVQDGNVEVVVVVRRNGVEISREMIPPEPEAGRWLVMCASEPIDGGARGTYRVEVWDGDVKAVQASGEYRITAD